MAANYRFIKIDNAAPTLTNVIQNKYFDWVESEWIWLDQNALNGTQNQRDAIDLQQILKKRTGKAAAVEGLVTQAFIHSFGASGMVALNTIPGNTPSLPVNQVNPVATSTHAIGGVLSSCRTPQVRVPTSF